MDAVLWDMDGVLVDSEPLWTLAEQELAADLGRVWDERIKARVVGTRLDVAVPTILRWFGAPDGPDDVARTADRLLARMVELFAARLPLLPGVPELLAALDRAGVPTALVSSSYRVLVDAVLVQGVGPFALSVAGDEVGQGKPHPEPYLTAARGLGVDPRRCVVVEDSPAGVLSAEAAGCTVVAVPTVRGVDLGPGPRRLVADSLAEVRVSHLRLLSAGATTA